MYRSFEVRREGVVAGSPEQVWDALTRRAAAWIWEIEYEPRVGGAERGLSPAGGTVTVWDLPHRFQTRAELPDGWRNELDYTFEPHPDGTLMRYAHRSVAEVGEYDAVYEGCVQHTDFYLHSMDQYVRHFSGRDAAYVSVETTEPFAALCDRLGLPASAAVGDDVRLQFAGLPAIEGTVDYRTPHFVGVRADDTLLRVYGRDVWDAPSDVALHLFGEDADTTTTERALSTFVNPTEAVA